MCLQAVGLALELPFPLSEEVRVLLLAVLSLLFGLGLSALEHLLLDLGARLHRLAALEVRLLQEGTGSDHLIYVVRGVGVALEVLLDGLTVV